MNQIPNNTTRFGEIVEMKHLFWAAVALLFTAQQAVADVIPDSTFGEKVETFWEGIEIHPEISALAIGLILGSTTTWLFMRSRKKNGSHPK
jgi:hypothetical protein